MRLRKFGGAILTGALACGCSASGTPEGSGVTDFEMAKALVGTWSGDEEGSGGTIKAVTTFMSDGIVQSAPEGNPSPRAALTGTWKVEGGHLIEKIERSGGSRPYKKGQVVKEKIVSVDEKEFRYTTEKGKDGVRTRIP